MSFLAEILSEKKREIAEAKKAVPMEILAERVQGCAKPRPFKWVLQQVPFALIAEIKKASPSKGTLVSHFDHRKLAMDFQEGGAQALSVLTDRKYFGGDASFIQQVKEVVELPILRKDFIIDMYQAYESRALGADAILLIVKALSVEELRLLYDCAVSLGMAVLVEAHTEKEIEIANAINADIIGINNRDLSTFAVSLETSLKLRHFVRPEAYAVSESGVRSPADVLALRDAGFRAALIGEGLVRQADRPAAIRELIPR